MILFKRSSQLVTSLFKKRRAEYGRNPWHDARPTMHEHYGYWTIKGQKYYDASTLQLPFLLSTEDTAFDITLLNENSNLLVVGVVPFSTQDHRPSDLCQKAEKRSRDQRGWLAATANKMAWVQTVSMNGSVHHMWDALSVILKINSRQLKNNGFQCSWQSSNLPSFYADLSN